MIGKDFFDFAGISLRDQLAQALVQFDFTDLPPARMPVPAEQNDKMRREPLPKFLEERVAGQPHDFTVKFHVALRQRNRFAGLEPLLRRGRRSGHWIGRVQGVSPAVRRERPAKPH